MLTLAVTAGAIPSGSAFGAHGCSMPCCKGADGLPGDCKGGSCPISHLGKAKAKPPKPAGTAPSCHTGGGAPASHEDASAEHHAEPTHDSSHEQDADRIRHTPHGDVSPRDTSTESASVSATLSKPCPPDCGGIPNASTQLRRGRDEAAVSFKFRPRPPDGEVSTRDTASVNKTSSELRRQYPPRAPPAV
ncbi:MAG: hypothetical protein ABW208_07865 [Pyrinomonadaceae bacterium]